LNKYLSVLVLLSAISVSAVSQAIENPAVITQPQSERLIEGLETLNQINGDGSGEKIVDVLKEVSPDLAKYAIEYGFGDLFNRTVLNHKTKEIVIIANLAAMGNAQPQLKAHINAALNIGVSKEEIAEIMILTSAYAGFPTAINSTLALKSVLTKRKNQK
jgi:4-carboxymuconolactone decarboxylase